MRKDTNAWRTFVENVKRQEPIAWISLAVSVVALVKALLFD